MRTPYTVVPTSNEVVDRNLRAISAALRTLTAATAAVAAAAPAQALEYVGKLTASGTITLPAGTVEAIVRATGNAPGLGSLDMDINGLGAGYQWCVDGSGFGAVAVLPLFASTIGGTDFTADAHVSLAPSTAFAQIEHIEPGSFGPVHSSGYVAAAALTSLGFTATALTGLTVDVWALVET